MQLAPADPLVQRRAALEALGFTCVHHAPDHLVAVRCAMVWPAATRLTLVVRVRRLRHLDPGAARVALDALQAQAAALDPSLVPRGFQQGRTVVDVVLLDEPDEAAAAVAASTSNKLWGGVALLVVAQPDGRWSSAQPIWARAFLPLVLNVASAAATGTVTPLPTPPGLVLLGVLAWPGVVLLVPMCCGVPLLVPLLALVLERRLVPAPYPGEAPALPPG